MPSNDSLAESMLLDAIRAEQDRRLLTGILLIGMQSAATVRAAGEIVGPERVALLHLDRATGAAGAALSSGVANRERFLGDAPTGPERHAVVGLNVEAAKSYRLLREVVEQTAGQVEPDGVVLVAGPKKGGAEVAARVLRERFEAVELLAYRQGQRIYRATGPRPAPDVRQESSPDQPATARNAPAPEQIEAVTLRGQELRLLQDERIFARGRLDPATRMLAGAFDVPSSGTVLDLGCGGGVLGILAARLAPASEVVLVDSDPLAVDVSRRNAALNGASNVSVYLSDVLAGLPGRAFTTVIMNPPFHRGRAHDNALAERFLTEASLALQPGGSLFVVCNRFLPYERTLTTLLGPVHEVVGDRQYKVLLARRTAGPRVQSASHHPARHVPSRRFSAGHHRAHGGHDGRPA
jgi:16S rRNA (guanine1207-N2)-methyltransferase